MKIHSALGAATIVPFLAAFLGAGPLQAAQPSTAGGCPVVGWAENLVNYLKPDAPFPTSDTKGDVPANSAPDCVFQQWAAEAFVWATAIGSDGVPRFMDLPTPADLLGGSGKHGPRTPRLQLAARSLLQLGMSGFTEGAGAIVEADGNMLVARNGYPVYASVHMNPSYFATARKNLVATGGYLSQPADSYFDLGAAVFKATWLRLAPNEAPPHGAYVTQAQVPILKKYQPFERSPYYAVYPSGKVQTVKVALVGLHVVGYTDNHPEFLWATFEHHGNSPRTADNQFNPLGSDPNGYTLYQANTPYTQVNICNPPDSCTQTYNPPQLQFNPSTQRLSPATNVVLQNRTGGANFGNGPADIAGVNTQTQQFLAGRKVPQSDFANYDLIGTVWLASNFYTGTSKAVLGVGASDAIGSVNLANSTAETFEQYPNNIIQANVQNCFMCHNPTTLPNSHPGQPGSFPPRRISISHVLEVGSPEAVQNFLYVPIQRPYHHAPAK